MSAKYNPSRCVPVMLPPDSSTGTGTLPVCRRATVSSDRRAAGLARVARCLRGAPGGEQAVTGLATPVEDQCVLGATPGRSVANH